MLKAIKNLDEYYDYMYDIENLTNLNAKSKREKDKKIIAIENLVRNNKCLEARRLIKKELSKDKSSLKINMIKTAPRFASVAPFLCLIFDHLECPDID